MIESSWRVEKARSIWFGAFSSQKTINSRLPKLVGFKLKTASLEGRLPELRLALSDGLWFGSYACEQGQQEWAIFTMSHCYYAKAQSFYKEKRKAMLNLAVKQPADEPSALLDSGTTRPHPR